jgi:hypothetical protein
VTQIRFRQREQAKDYHSIPQLVAPNFVNLF